jgi:glycosyltransferase involved in cell wall biosynthesis
VTALNICILAAGAGGMYCGSCLRDNNLARALRRAGHAVGLVPLYTPLRTEVQDQSVGRVFYGGVNTYLQYATRLFRRTPRFIDWLFDRKWLLKLAGRFGAQTSPAKLGPFTLSILEGEHGPQVKELRRLIQFIKADLRPDIVSIPNLMFIGLAGMLKRELNAPVICELTGEDIFLDALIEPYKSEARRIIHDRAADVARFVATSGYYADRMADYIGISRDHIDVVYPGIPTEVLDAPRAPRSSGAAPAIGYLARICPEKGLDRLVDAFLLLRKMPGMENIRLRAAGWMANRQWHAALESRIRQTVWPPLPERERVGVRGQLRTPNF